MMLRKFALFLCFLVILFSHQAKAGPKAGPTVVELYTSQGCMLCPPADKFFSQLSINNNIITLSFHVDYWNYLGWVDNFARPENTQRQRAYAALNDARTIATPQFIVGGRKIVSGLHPARIFNAVQESEGRPDNITLEMKRKGNKVAIEVKEIGGRLEKPVIVTLYRTLNERVVHVKRGENRGLVLRYDNVVIGADNLGRWTGGAAFSREVALPKSGEGVVVVVQDAPLGVIRAARRFISR